MTTHTAPAPNKFDRLKSAATEASRLREYATNADVIALKVERVQRAFDTLMYVALTLGLLFTMVNVQVFAAEGADQRELQWWSAWVLDPMVSLALIGVLLAEQILTRYGVRTSAWAHALKLFTFAATYGMNTWQSWHDHVPSRIVLHSIPPVLVFLIAEAGPALREKLTQAVLNAAAGVDRSIEVDETASSSIGSMLRSLLDRSTQNADRTPVEVDRTTADRPSTGPDSASTDRADQGSDRRAIEVDRSAAQSTRSTLDRGADLHESTRIEARSTGSDRADQGSTEARSTEEKSTETTREIKSIDVLREEMADAVAAGRLDRISSESIRKELRIGPKKARQLRDEWFAAHPEDAPDRPLLRAVGDE